MFLWIVPVVSPYIDYVLSICVVGFFLYQKQTTLMNVVAVWTYVLISLIAHPPFSSHLAILLVPNIEHDFFINTLSYILLLCPIGESIFVRPILSILIQFAKCILFRLNGVRSPLKIGSYLVKHTINIWSTVAPTNI